MDSLRCLALVWLLLVGSVLVACTSTDPDEAAGSAPSGPETDQSTSVALVEADASVPPTLPWQRVQLEVAGLVDPAMEWSLDPIGLLRGRYWAVMTNGLRGGEIAFAFDAFLISNDGVVWRRGPAFPGRPNAGIGLPSISAELLWFLDLDSGRLLRSEDGSEWLPVTIDLTTEDLKLFADAPIDKIRFGSSIVVPWRGSFHEGSSGLYASTDGGATFQFVQPFDFDEGGDARETYVVSAGEDGFVAALPTTPEVGATEVAMPLAYSSDGVSWTHGATPLTLPAESAGSPIRPVAIVGPERWLVAVWEEPADSSSELPHFVGVALEGDVAADLSGLNGIVADWPPGLTPFGPVQQLMAASEIADVGGTFLTNAWSYGDGMDRWVASSDLVNWARVGFEAEGLYNVVGSKAFMSRLGDGLWVLDLGLLADD